MAEGTIARQMPDLEGTVILVGALQGAVMTVVLALRRTDRLANRFLAGLVGTVAAMLLLGTVSEHWGFHGHPHLLGLGAVLPFLFGPLLYLYITALTRPIERFEPRMLVHGLLFVVNLVFMLQVFYLHPGDEKLRIVNEHLAGRGPLSAKVMGTVEIVQALAYIAASLRALRGYGRKIEGYFSDLTRIDLHWLRVMVLAHAAVWTLVLACHVLMLSGAASPIVRALDAGTQLASALVVFLTGYVSLWQPELFQKARVSRVAFDSTPIAAEAPAPSDGSATAATAARTPKPTPSEVEAAPSGTDPGRRKYQRNRLDDDEAESFAHQLRELMERKQAYRDAALTLPVLAEALGATPHLLSQVLNVRIGRSFYVFVNSYRAEALKAALADPAQTDRGVLDLALEVGFNSKSTLNSFFKKHTGVTPTEFRRRARSVGNALSEN